MKFLMMGLMVIVSSIFLLGNVHGREDAICPPFVLPAGADDLWMKETGFSLADFYKAFENLSTRQQLLYRAIIENKKIGLEGLGFVFHNSMTVFKGVMLKQIAMRNRADYLLFKKLNENQPGKRKAILKARKNYRSARKEFCDFLKQAKVAD